MKKALLRTSEDIEELYKQHVKTVYRVCFTYMKNQADTEDAVQNTFYKLVRYSGPFENEEHEKAWLIRTASNTCKDSLKRAARKHESTEQYPDIPDAAFSMLDETLQVVLDLPDKYKTAVYLYYYETYTSEEIARILCKPPSTIRNYLYEARLILREKLQGGEECGQTSI